MSDDGSSEKDGRNLPETMQEWLELIKTTTPDLILTKRQWRSYVDLRKESEDHPLANLLDEEIEPFTKSLVFRKTGGVHKGQYELLLKHISEEQFLQVANQFGFSKTLFENIKDHQKMPNGDCKYWSGHFCVPH